MNLMTTLLLQLFLIVGILFSHQSAEASNASALKNSSFNETYKLQWRSSGLVKLNENYQYTVLVKKSNFLKNQSQAVVTYTENNHLDLSTVQNTFKKALKEQCVFKQEKIQDVVIEECLSFKNGVLFSLAFNKKTQQYSTVSMQLRHLMPTYVEARVLQLESLKTPASKTSWIMNHLLQKAHAAEISAGTAQYLNSVNTALLGSTNTAVNNVAGSVNNLSGSVDGLSASIDRNGIRIDNAADSIKDTFSSKNIAKISAIAGVTFGFTQSLGSMFANFLVNGTYSMMKNLINEVKGDFSAEEKKMRLERFEAQMKSFKDTEPQIASLASQLAVASAEITLAQGITVEQYLAKIDQDILKLKESKLEASDSCYECSEAEKLTKIKQLENYKKVVQAAGASSQGQSSEQVCEKINELNKTWINAEATLLNSRRLVLQDLRVFNGYMIEGIQPDTAFQENRKQNNSCLATAEDKLKKARREVKSGECEEGDLSSVKCQRLAAYQSMVDSCQEMEKYKSSDKDQVDLETATAQVSQVLAQFSKELTQMSCDGVVNKCKPGKLDKMRTEIKGVFEQAAKSCPQFFFAKLYNTPKENPKAQVQKPANSNQTLFGRIKGFFTSPPQADQQAAQAVVDSTQ